MYKSSPKAARAEKLSRASLGSNVVRVHDPQVKVVGMADPLLVGLLGFLKSEQNSVFLRVVNNGATSLQTQITD